MNDLLDMALPSDGGMNFGNLVNQTAPHMMPVAPSGGAAAMYGMDAGRNDQMIRQAQTLAMLDAAMRAQRADEFGAAGPGRRAEIDTKNQLAQDQNRDIGTMRRTQGAQRENALGAEEVKAIKQAVDKLAPFLNAWDKAETPEAKQAIIDAMDNAGAKFGKIELGKLNIKDADVMMKVLRHAQTNDPKFETEELRAASREKVAKTTADARISSTQMRTDTQLKLKKMGIETHQYPDLYQNIEAKRARGEGLTKDEAETLKDLIFMKALGAQAKMATDKGTLGIEDGSIKTTKPEPIELPAPAARPPTPKNDSTTPPAAALVKYRQLMDAAGGDRDKIERIQGDFKSKGWTLPE